MGILNFEESKELLNSQKVNKQKNAVTIKHFKEEAREEERTEEEANPLTCLEDLGHDILSLCHENPVLMRICKGYFSLQEDKRELIKELDELLEQFEELENNFTSSLFDESGNLAVRVIDKYAYPNENKAMEKAYTLFTQKLEENKSELVAEEYRDFIWVEYRTEPAVIICPHLRGCLPHELIDAMKAVGFTFLEDQALFIHKELSHISPDSLIFKNN